MTDPPRYPDTADDTGPRGYDRPTPSDPTRTKVVLVIIGAVLLAAMVGLHLAGVTPH